jgi:hypothetical protein
MDMVNHKVNRLGAEASGPLTGADGLLAAWRQQLGAALRKPWLAAGWLAQNRALLQRFTRTYDHLRQQPRPVRRRLQRQWGASLAGAALALALLNAPAHATPPGITVDGTTCTLVDAISAANSDTAVGGCAAGSGADTITLQTDVTLTASNNFALNTYNGLPLITSEITIEGAGYTIQRDASAPAFRLLAVSSAGNLTLHQTTLSGGDGAAEGGGIFNKGTVTVSNSTLSGNTATAGGGIFNSYATLTVSNSTLSGNIAGYRGGGGIFNLYGTVNLARSLISGNSTYSGGGEIFTVYGTVNAANFNLIGYGGNARSVDFTPSGSDIVPSQALAAILDTTLADNGGDTLTHALVTGSPAIDAAGDSGLATDQRGVTRPQGAADDIGAFELEPAAPVNARLNGTDCNLIDAIIAANTDTATGACAAGTAGADTITLLDDVTLTASNNFSYDSDTGLPLISSEITIEGAGNTIQRDASAPAFRLLAVSSAGNLTLHQTTLSGGNISGKGGAIFNEGGTVAVSNSTLSGNTAARGGGAIYNYDYGTLTVSNSTLSGNTTARGGGIYNYGTLTVSNSTLSGNVADEHGGGIFNSGGTATVSNSTLSGNTTARGGGIYNIGTLNLAHSLISGNSATSGSEIYNYISEYGNGTVNAANFNLIGYGSDARSTNFTPSGSDIVPSQALAAILDTTLADNGGDTLTHALVTGSPALDAAGDSGLATDQRGITRPQGAADDIGAFELEVVPATITIVLDARPNLPTNLGFGGSFGPFLLDDPAVNDSDAYTNTRTFTVPPGLYTVRRNNPASWFTTAIACTPDANAAINLAQRSAAITVAGGANVTCTYTVDRAAHITARAFNDLVRRTTNLGKRNAGDSWLEEWPMTVYTAPTATVANKVTSPTTVAGLYQASFSNLRPGDYTICTVLPDGSWTPTTPNALDPAYNKLCKTFTLVPGQLATVLFGAYQPTVVASEAFTPEDERITDEDAIVDQPYDPAEDETATAGDGLPRLFLPLIRR